MFDPNSAFAPSAPSVSEAEGAGKGSDESQPLGLGGISPELCVLAEPISSSVRIQTRYRLTFEEKDESSQQADAHHRLLNKTYPPQNPSQYQTDRPLTRETFIYKLQGNG
jgi:hypothetical protein